MNYDSASLTGRAIALLAPAESRRATRRIERVEVAPTTWSLTKAGTEAFRGSSYENAVWLMLAIGSLAALLLSFL
jgi:hypothetical protein